MSKTTDKKCTPESNASKNASTPNHACSHCMSKTVAHDKISHDRKDDDSHQLNSRRQNRPSKILLP